MPFENLKDNAEAVQEKLQNVLQSIVAYYKLWLFKVVMKSTTLLFKVLLMAVFLLIFLFFISLALAFYLSERFESYTFGFLAVSGVYFLLVLVLCCFKHKLMERRLLEKFSKIFFNE